MEVQVSNISISSHDRKVDAYMMGAEGNLACMVKKTLSLVFGPEESCPICLDGFKMDTLDLDEQAIALPCGHQLHSKCLRQLDFHRQKAGADYVCPTCRAAYNPLPRNIAIWVTELVGKDPMGLFADSVGKFIAHIGDIDDPRTWYFTDDPSKARLFKDLTCAQEFYCWQSRCRPVREDGKDNRPLRAFSIQLVEL